MTTPSAKGTTGSQPLQERSVRQPPGSTKAAVELHGGTVSGQATGKSITSPTVQVVFRKLCRQALEGYTPAPRRVVELMLTLEPVARAKSEEAKEKDKEAREASRSFYGCLGSTPTRLMSSWTREERAGKRPRRDDERRAAARPSSAGPCGRRSGLAGARL